MKVILSIVDGLGICDSPQLSIPFIDKYLDRAILLNASGEAVGLSEGQMGNSEVGHITIGSGRIVPQHLTKINNAIANDRFPVIDGEQFHIIGLLSNGGVHSHIDHILHIVKKVSHKRCFIHIISDGRDTSPKSIKSYISQLEGLLSDKCKIATISGRYYAMDRDNRSERTDMAFNAIALGRASEAYNRDFIDKQYELGITDEFFEAACDENYRGIGEEDTVIFCNFRSDRMRQIVRKVHAQVKCKEIISMVDYFDGEISSITNLFKNDDITNTLGEVIAKNGKKQLRIAETEKYAHVTFFLNCGREAPYEGEDRILIPSPKVATYDLQPEMSAFQITEKLIEVISDKSYDFICINFANADMVGHTGNFEAAKKACAVLDKCLEILSKSAIENNYVMVITSDHGNIEQMINNEKKEPHKSHTLNKVPLISLGCDLAKIDNSNYGLRDIAPTILDILAIEVPMEMTGRSLVKKTLL
jgi:2,3-bisphosphoglycerate-independent phosphoglycerate mutase